MNSIFWLGIVIGAVISLFVSVIANLYTPKIRTYLDRRTEIKLSNKKADELKQYEFAKALIAGSAIAVQQIQTSRDIAQRYRHYEIVSLIITTGASVWYLIPAYEAYRWLIICCAILTLVLANFCSFASDAMGDVVEQTIRKASNMKEYEKDIRKKWGDDAI